MTIVETARLRLRRLSTADAPFMLELLNQPSFIRNIGDRGVRTLNDAVAYLENGPIASYERHGFGLFLVELKSDGTPIGVCGILRREELPEADIGFSLLPEYWSQGFAWEAAAAVQDYARATLGLRRMVAITSPDNEPSAKLLGKLGFRFERMIEFGPAKETLRLFSAALSMVVALALSAPEARQPTGQVAGPVIQGLDHIPIAVNNLAAAAERYRALGFSLKPGRPHANGITNQHVKFPDGTELELITAPEPKDALTAKYRRHLASGDGPAFLAFFVPRNRQTPERIETIDYIFFGPRNASPTDRPEHFAHPNTAHSFVQVWLAGADLSAERRLLEKNGATFARRTVHAPDPIDAEVARLQEGEVVFLPESRQIVPGRRIVGATVAVKNLAGATAVLESAQLHPKPATRGSSVFLAPAVSHGLWLELREVR
jgi:RimJ/RimL family protein N-acetyltransferase